MTTYGTVPSSSSPRGTTTSSNLDFISLTKQRIYTNLSTRKPWKLMFNFHSFSIPLNFHDAVFRLKTNLSFFLTNYIIILLFILFLSLLWHPISLIVFIVMMVAWLFLYFLRNEDEPLVVIKMRIDERVVMSVLGVLTVVFLLLTHVTVNVLVSLAVGVVVVVVHGMFRRTNDLAFHEEEVGVGFLASTS